MCYVEADALRNTGRAEVLPATADSDQAEAREGRLRAEVAAPWTVSSWSRVCLWPRALPHPCTHSAPISSARGSTCSPLASVSRRCCVQGPLGFGARFPSFPLFSQLPAGAPPSWVLPPDWPYAAQEQPSAGASAQAAPAWCTDEPWSLLVRSELTLQNL